MQLAARIGDPCTSIQHYINHKNKIRAAIAKDVGISSKQVKTCLLALMYGAHESTWHEAAIPQQVGDKAQELYQHPFFSNFAEEIARSRKEIIKQWSEKNQRSIINAMDKRICKKEDERFIMAHIQQGLEARMLHIAMEHYGNQIILLQHDGFSTEDKIDCDPIILQIADELNLSMQMTSKMHRNNIKRI